MKKEYEKPLIEIEEFEVDEICTLSSNTTGTADETGWSQIQ